MAETMVRNMKDRREPRSRPAGAPVVEWPIVVLGDLVRRAAVALGRGPAPLPCSP